MDDKSTAGVPLETISLAQLPDLTAAEVRSAMLSEANKSRVLDVVERLTYDETFTTLIGDAIRSGRLDLRLAIAWLAEVSQADRYLEIGVRRGFSMSSFASVRPEATVYGFDMWVKNYTGIDNPGPDFVRDELAKVGFRGDATFTSGNSHVTVPIFFGKQKPTLRDRLAGRTLRYAGPEFDMILVDGDHSILGAYQDLTDVMPHIRVGGVLVFDDIAPDLSQFDEAGLAAVRAELGEDPKGLGGLLGVWHAIQQEHPNFKYFEFTEDAPGVAFAVRQY